MAAQIYQVLGLCVGWDELVLPNTQENQKKTQSLGEGAALSCQINYLDALNLWDCQNPQNPKVLRINLLTEQEFPSNPH